MDTWTGPRHSAALLCTYIWKGLLIFNTLSVSAMGILYLWLLRVPLALWLGVDETNATTTLLFSLRLLWCVVTIVEALPLVIGFSSFLSSPLVWCTAHKQNVDILILYYIFYFLIVYHINMDCFCFIATVNFIRMGSLLLGLLIFLQLYQY